MSTGHGAAPGASRPDGTDLIGAWLRSPVTGLSLRPAGRSTSDRTQRGAETSMANGPTGAVGGVDTHKHTHYAAVIDGNGRLLGHEEFRADKQGYTALLSWLRSHGRIVVVGVESTGNFGAGLTRFLVDAGVAVVEVNKPNRQARHFEGKSDRLDAEQIARSALADVGTATPKSKSGPVEVIRTLRVARASAVRARTQAFNNMF